MFLIDVQGIVRLLLQYMNQQRVVVYVLKQEEQIVQKCKIIKIKYMNADVKKAIPYIAAVGGVYVANYLYNMKPMGGMIGKVIAFAGGAVGAYYISNMIVNKAEIKELTSPETK